jgi:hypothetical protein
MFLQSANLPPSSPAIEFEGRCGKSAIKQLLGPAKVYVETIDGVTWLKTARPSVMQKNSASFHRLFSTLAALNCWWLNQMQLSLPANEEAEGSG